MGNALLVNPYPAGFDSTQTALTVSGSVMLYDAAVSTGEPINWNQFFNAVPYSLVNYRGNGKNGTGAAYTTGFAVSAGTCTCTANNNFFAGQQVTFLGNKQTLSAKFNNVVVTIVSATSTNFTFLTASTGTTTTSDVGIAVRYNPETIPVPGENLTQSLTVTALSASSTTLTVTAANNLLPGAVVTISVATGTLGPKLAGLQLPVIQSTGTAFTATMPSALSGTTGTGTGTGVNGPQPYSVKFWSALDSGYVYQYNSTFGTLFAMTSAAFTPAGTSANPTITTGTNATVTAVIATNGGALTQAAGQTGLTGVIAGAFTGTAVPAAGLSNLAAAAYPSGVLNDVIMYEARFARG